MEVTQILPQQAYSTKQVRENEAKAAQLAQVSLYQLMENAGHAVFSLIAQHSSVNKRKMLVFCGKGNNGGDGFVIARLALAAGYQVSVIMLAAPQTIQGDALTALNKYRQCQGHCLIAQKTEDLIAYCHEYEADIIVDALLGTGFRGEISGVFQQAITWINSQKAPVFSVDVPSGLNADTGVGANVTVQANFTVTFIALKQGLLTGQSANFLGQLFFAGLGVETYFNQVVASHVKVVSTHQNLSLPPRSANSHKGNIGLVLTIGGGQGMPGAIRLCSEAALRCGAALVSVCCAELNQTMVLNGRPELMLAANNAEQLKSLPVLHKAKVITIGTGLGRSQWAEQLFKLITQSTASQQIRVFDADSLYFLAKNRHQSDNHVLTPHPGEAATLLHCSIADIEADRFVAVKEIALRYGGICVLKGAGTLISDGKTVWINTTGNAGMASGGMGDVLSGVIAACVLQANSIIEAVLLAVFIHGQAADIIAQKYGQRGILASDLFTPLQTLINQH